MKKKIYGYMVGYRELGSRFIRYYTDFTYKRALFTLRFYQKNPPRERKTNRSLIDPVWEIQPITKKAILKSILDEIPFPRKNATIWVTPLLYIIFYPFLNQAQSFRQFLKCLSMLIQNTFCRSIYLFIIRQSKRLAMQVDFLHLIQQNIFVKRICFRCKPSNRSIFI